MKTFKNYIVETDNLTILNEGKIIPFILKNCQQWFREICGHEVKTEDEFNSLLNNGYYLYRGRMNAPLFYIETAHENRKPRSWRYSKLMKRYYKNCMISQIKISETIY